MRVLFIGDVVGQPGRRVMRMVLPNFLKSNSIDCCIVNAENASNGLGVNAKIINELGKLGVDAITLGNHAFSDSSFASEVAGIKNCVRPANVTSWPGLDYCVVTKGSEKLGIINLLGQVSISPTADNPFVKADSLIAELKDNQNCTSIFLDFHAEATAEKRAMGYWLDGRISCVAGTHTHVQTADECILPHGTGYITDCGMTGACESVLGMDVNTCFTRLVSKMHSRYEPATGPAMICGIIFETNLNGSCVSIKRVCEYE